MYISSWSPQYRYNSSINENILVNDPDGDVIEMDEPTDDWLLQENHEIHLVSTKEEYKNEETEDEDENKEEERVWKRQWLLLDHFVLCFYYIFLIYDIQSRIIFCNF